MFQGVQRRTSEVFSNWHYKQHLHMVGRNIPFVHRHGATICITNDGRTLCHVHVGDIMLHTKLRVKNNVCAFRCPCIDCKCGRWKNIQIIRRRYEAASGSRSIYAKVSTRRRPPRMATHRVECGSRTSLVMTKF